MTAIERIMAFALLLGVSGCVSSPRFAYQGTWKGEIDLPIQPDTPEYIAVSMRMVKLTFDGKGRFSLLEHGMPKSGNFVPTGYGAELQVDQIMSRPIETQPESVRKDVSIYEVRPQQDGTLLLNNQRTPKESIRLVRSSKP